MSIDNDYPIVASFEREETLYNSFLLGVPADRFSEARRQWMDSAPSMETFSRVLGATVMLGEKRRVIEEFADTRLDFDSIVSASE